jgi:hypothetical protein
VVAAANVEHHHWPRPKRERCEELFLYPGRAGEGGGVGLLEDEDGGFDSVAWMAALVDNAHATRAATSSTTAKAEVNYAHTLMYTARAPSLLLLLLLVLYSYAAHYGCSQAAAKAAKAKADKETKVSYAHTLVYTPRAMLITV